MDIEIKNLLKGLREDPQSYAEKFVNDMYKSRLPVDVYDWHMEHKVDRSWNDYIIDVLNIYYQISSGEV